MKDFFKDIFDYQHHFNQQMAGQILEHPDKVPEDAHKLFSHVLNAHQVWNSRILNQAPFQVWEMHPPSSYKAIDTQNYTDTLRILHDADLSETITYTNSKGFEFSNTVRDILFHVNNHSTYHRAQLVSRFKVLGITPLVTDYIFFKR